MTLNVTSWTKHQAFLMLSQSRVEGRYGEPAPAAPTVTRSQDYDGQITFSSSDEDVVKVNAETGELTVIGVGTAIISVSGAETDYRLAPAAKTYTVIIAEATGITETADSKAADDSHFDLQGRRANPKGERNGIYVTNGKKVVKR